MTQTLLMPFKDQSENFVHGFECGVIWEKMKRGCKFDKYFDINGFCDCTERHVPIEQYGVLQAYRSMSLKYSIDDH